LVAFNETANRGVFSLNQQNHQISGAGGILAKNDQDPYAFLFLDSQATSDNALVGSVCAGVLSGDYPNTTANKFQLCDGYLSAGQPSAFGPDGAGDTVCESITLQFSAA